MALLVFVHTVLRTIIVACVPEHKDWGKLRPRSCMRMRQSELNDIPVSISMILPSWYTMRANGRAIIDKRFNAAIVRKMQNGDAKALDPRRTSRRAPVKLFKHNRRWLIALDQTLYT